MDIYFDVKYDKNLNLISVGMMSNNGKEFYAENNEFNDKDISYLMYDSDHYEEDNGSIYMKHSLATIKANINSWIRKFNENITFISDRANTAMAVLEKIIDFTDLNLSPCHHDVNDDIAAYRKVSISTAYYINRSDIVPHNINDQYYGTAIYMAKYICNLHVVASKIYSVESRILMNTTSEIFDFCKVIKTIAGKFYAPVSDIRVGLNRMTDFSNVGDFTLTTENFGKDLTVLDYNKWCMDKGIIKPVAYEFVCKVYELSRFEHKKEESKQCE